MKRISKADMKDSQKTGKTALRRHKTTTKQEASTKVPKENQETGLREQADKQNYAETPVKMTIYMNYKERPLGRKGRKEMDNVREDTIWVSIQTDISKGE